MAFVQQIGQHVVLQPPARLDALGGIALQRKLIGVVPKPNCLWVVDMKQVDFVDSSGLLALLSGLRVARKQGCRLVVCNLKASIRMIFEIAQLDRIFEVTDTFDLSEIRDRTQSVPSEDIAAAVA